MGAVTPSTILVESLSKLGVRPQQGLLLACSGGLDSVAMVHACCEVLQDYRVVVVSVDHGLTDDSAARSAFVVSLCTTLGLPAFVLTADPDHVVNGEGTEDGARRERYRLLENFRRQNGLDWIMTAHLAEDQAETLLMRLATGSGLRGLRGIAPKRGHIIRPWLAMTRPQLKKWISQRAIEWVDDPTNESMEFTRNAVRHRLLADAGTIFGEHWARPFVRSAMHVRNTHAALDLLLTPYVEEWIGESAGSLWIKRDGIQQVPAPIRHQLVVVVMRRLERLGLSRGRGREVTTSSLCEWLISGHQGEAMTLGGGLIAIVEKSRLWFGALAAAPTFPSIELTGPGRYMYGEWIIDVLTDEAHEQYEGAFSIWVPRNVPVFVRSVRTGELFRRRAGRKKLRRLWMDMGVPARFRSHLPIIAADDEILWAAFIGVATPDADMCNPKMLTIRTQHAPVAAGRAPKEK